MKTTIRSGGGFRAGNPSCVSTSDDLLAGRSFLFVSPAPRDRLINRAAAAGRVATVAVRAWKPRPPAGHRQPMVGGYIVSAALLDVLAAAACNVRRGGGSAGCTHTDTHTLGCSSAGRGDAQGKSTWPR